MGEHIVQNPTVGRIEAGIDLGIAVQLAGVGDLHVAGARIRQRVLQRGQLLGHVPDEGLLDEPVELATAVVLRCPVELVVDERARLRRQPQGGTGHLTGPPQVHLTSHDQREDLRKVGAKLVGVQQEPLGGVGAHCESGRDLRDGELLHPPEPTRAVRVGNGRLRLLGGAGPGTSGLAGAQSAILVAFLAVTGHGLGERPLRGLERPGPSGHDRGRRLDIAPVLRIGGQGVGVTLHPQRRQPEPFELQAGLRLTDPTQARDQGRVVGQLLAQFLKIHVEHGASDLRHRVGRAKEWGFGAVGEAASGFPSRPTPRSTRRSPLGSGRRARCAARTPRSCAPGPTADSSSSRRARHGR